MKKKQFETLCKTLLPYLPGFSCKGWLLFAKPVNHVLRGFCCDDSGFDQQKFAVTVFYLPLYVPTKHLHFNMGRRLKDARGCDIWWNLSEPQLRDELAACIQRDGLPFLEGVSQPHDVPIAVHRYGADSDPYKLEAIAYSLAMTDDVLAAQQALERLAKVLDRDIAWQVEMAERATLLAQKLSIDPQEARRQLAEWEQTTMKNLGLGSLCGN
jgi:hypothetical protein